MLRWSSFPCPQLPLRMHGPFSTSGRHSQRLAIGVELSLHSYAQIKLLQARSPQWILLIPCVLLKRACSEYC